MIKKTVNLLILILVFLAIFTPKIYVKAEENESEFDSEISKVLDGISEEDFEEIANFLNSVFGDNKGIKERIISLLSGEINLNFKSILKWFLSQISLDYNSSFSILFYVVLLAVTCSILNRIFVKNNDNTEKSTIFYIFYALTLTVLCKLIFNAFEFSKQCVLDTQNKMQILYPLAFSLSSLLGDFTVSTIKPFTVFLGYFSLNLFGNFFIPLLSLITVTLIIGNLSNGIKLNSLNKTLISLYKWVLGIITLIYSFMLSLSTVSSGQFAGISVKVLKYVSGSLVPIVGSFISSGTDVFFSAVVLVKNAVGIIAVLYLLFSTVGKGLSLLVISFLSKFISSVLEPIVDERFIKVINGVGEILTLLSSFLLLSGFVYFITTLSFIFQTVGVV